MLGEWDGLEGGGERERDAERERGGERERDAERERGGERERDRVGDRRLGDLLAAGGDCSLYRLLCPDRERDRERRYSLRYGERDRELERL